MKNTAAKASKLVQNKKVLVGIPVVIVLIMGVLLLLAYLRADWCMENCEVSVNSSLEELASKKAFVTYSDGEAVGDRNFEIRGMLNEVSSDEQGYSVYVSDLWNKVSVDGSLVKESVTVSFAACDEDCDTVFTELSDHAEYQFSEITYLSLSYSLRDLGLKDKVGLYWLLLKSSFADDVDISDYVVISDVSFVSESPEQISTTCTALASGDEIVGTVKNIREAVVLMVSDNVVESESGAEELTIAEKFMKQKVLKCSTCSEMCEFGSIDNVGLDYLFQPMLDFYLSSGEEGYDTAVGLEILASSYGVDRYDSFPDFVADDESILHSHADSTFQGSEPVCLPYIASLKRFGSDDSRTVFYRKICVDLGRKERDVLDGADFSEKIYSDSEFFDAFNEILTTYEKKGADGVSKLELAGISPTSVFVNQGMDGFVYGVAMEDDELTGYANVRILMALTDVLGTFDDGNAIASTHSVRSLVLAMIIKRQMATSDADEKNAEQLLQKFLDLLPNGYVGELFDVNSKIIYPNLTVDDDMTFSLSHALELWLIDPDFYNSYVEADIRDSISDYFYSYFMAADCGKADEWMFASTNTDGECFQWKYNYRRNLATALYLLMYSDANES